MPYKLFDFSSDIGIEAEAPTPEEALVELARAVAHVTTAGSAIHAREPRPIDLTAGHDWRDVAVALVNEAIFLFDTEQFLAARGHLTVEPAKNGTRRVSGALMGDFFDPSRHTAGRGVKAATYHDALYEAADGRHRFRLVLDL